MKPTFIDSLNFQASTRMNFQIQDRAAHHVDPACSTLNRFLALETFRPPVLWDQVRAQIKFSERGFLMFADSVPLQSLPGVINCLYVNPESGEHWTIDQRPFEFDDDEEIKLDHVHDMFNSAIVDKQLPFATVLMDRWYATRDLMLLIEFLGKTYYGPLRADGLVDDAVAVAPYRRVNSLQWSDAEMMAGKTIKIKGFPYEHRVKLFQMMDSTNRSDWIVTNEFERDSTHAAQAMREIQINRYHGA